MNTDPDYVASNVLATSGFVNAAYPQGKRDILLNGLRSLHRIHAGRAWEDWQSVLNAYTMLTEEIVADLKERKVLGPDVDFRNVDVLRGSPFQQRFLPRWESYEALLGTNHKPLTKAERSNLRELVKTPAILVWYAGLIPYKQRQLTHPNRVIIAWKASQRGPRGKVEKRRDAVITELATDVVELKKDHASESDQNERLHDHINTLEAERDALLSEAGVEKLVADLKAEIEALRQRVAELEAELASLRGDDDRQSIEGGLREFVAGSGLTLAVATRAPRKPRKGK